MQLFITEFVDVGGKLVEQHSVGDRIIITEERIMHQVKHVLRGKVGMQFFVQQPIFAYHNTGEMPLGNSGNIGRESFNNKNHYRYLVSLFEIEKQKLVCEIVDKEKQSILFLQKKLCVALPNKFEKAELIVQKSTEIGLQHIIFFPAQYSQLRDMAEGKIDRLRKIAWEALEQSYGVIVPEVVFEKNIETILATGKNIVLDQDSDSSFFGDKKRETKEHFFVGPEGGRGEKDKETFSLHGAEKKSLGKNILRTETAAMVVAWEAVK